MISKAFFSSAGDVKEVRLAMDGGGQFRGFGHVEFNTEDGANKVLSRINECKEYNEVEWHLKAFYLNF